MIDLVKMMSDQQLTSIQTEIAAELQKIALEGNTMKLAILLSMLAAGSMDLLKNIDLSPFVEQCRKELGEIKKRYEDFQPIIQTHLQQNRKVVEGIGVQSDNLKRMEREIRNLMDAYDKMLADLLMQRDAWVVEDILKPQP